MVSADCWARDPAEHGSRRPPDERESRKWLDAYRVLQDIALRVPQTLLVNVGDREADLFELLALAREPASLRLLVRASQNRQRRVATDAGQPLKLREATLWVGIEGGFQGCRSDGRPGTEALWHGLQQLDVAVRMYLTFLPHERHEMRTEYPLDYLQPPAQDSS